MFDPASGEVVERQVEQKRVGGWDFAFSAPKSISLALTFGDTETRRELLAAHRAAVEAALRLLESEAVRVRVGAQGAFRHETHGLLAVVIEHAWARAVSADATPDPQLHTHVVVANMAKSREDDSEWWRTLDMQPVLREWKRAASATYQAVLRHEVSTRLGWEWAEPRNDLAELKQWPASVLRAFSRRREQIEAFLAGGETDLGTRAGGGHPDASGQGRAPRRGRGSRRRARAARRAPRRAPTRRAARARPPRAGAAWTRADSAASSSGLLGEHGLTERDSSFARGDVVRELAFALGAAPDTDSLLAAAGSFLAPRAGRPAGSSGGSRPAACKPQSSASRDSRNDPRRAHSSSPRPRRTIGIERVEARARLRAQRRAARPRPRRDRRRRLGVARARGRRIRQDDHARCHRPGLRASAGIPVAGVAPTGAAARVMSEAGIPARTVERALLDREQAMRAGIRPTPGIVLVDEAGTIGTRTLARLAEAVALADAKLVLVGDDAQLPAVPAGTSYANLLDQRTARPLARDAAALPHADRRARPRRGTRTRQPARRHAGRRRRLPQPQAAAQARSRRLTASAALAAAAAWHAEHVALGADPARIALIARSHELREPAQPARPRLDARRRAPRPRRPRPHRRRRSPSETSSSAAATTAASPSPTARAGASPRSPPTRSRSP